MQNPKKRTTLWAAEVRLAFAKLLNTELLGMLDLSVLETIGNEYLNNNALNVILSAEEEWNKWKEQYNQTAALDLDIRVREVNFNLSMLREGITFHIMTATKEWYTGPPIEEYLFTITEILFNEDQDIQDEKDRRGRRWPRPGPPDEDPGVFNPFIIKCIARISGAISDSREIRFIYTPLHTVYTLTNEPREREGRWIITNNTLFIEKYHTIKIHETN